MSTAALHELAATLSSAARRDRDHAATLTRTWQGHARHRFDQRHHEVAVALRHANHQVDIALTGLHATAPLPTGA